MRTLIRLTAIMPLMFISLLSADEVYRTVDESGNVTYTDVPPEGDASAERIELPPPPSAESLRETEQRNLELKKAAEEAKRARQKQQRERESRISEARKRLAEAEAQLQEAKVIQDEDRQNLAGGKRRIHPDYFERVKQAEAKVEAARKALREARGY